MLHQLGCKEVTKYSRTMYLFGRDRNFISFLLGLLLDELYHLIDLTLDLQHTSLISGVPQHHGV